MFRRPNFYLLCVVKLPEWKHRLIIPVPLFLVDEVMDLASWGIRLARFSRRSTLKVGIKMADIERICGSVESAWWAMRKAGSFTLAQVDSRDGTKVEIRLI